MLPQAIPKDFLMRVRPLIPDAIYVAMILTSIVGLSYEFLQQQ
jgi:hypothetical protein